MFNRYTPVTFAYIVLFAVMLAFPVGSQAQDWNCAQDLNNNGSIDAASEQSLCLAAAEGQLCPISSMDCVVKTSQANCPVSAPLNPSTGKCEVAPSCTIGTYDSSQNMCISSTIPNCSNGLAMFNDTRDICTSDTLCPPGAFYDSAKNACVTLIASTCPTGVVFNAGTGMCEADPTCNSGYSYSAATQKCELHTTTPPTCPNNTVFNQVTDKCEATPTCSTGTYNTTTHQCVNQYPANCPLGTMLNGGTGRCEAPPTCTTGTYNAVSKMCIYSGTASPTCPSGSTMTTSANCTAGYTFNPTSSRCERNPNCPVGSVFNTSTDQCEYAPTCSSGTYDAALNMCVLNQTSSPVCPVGSTFVGGVVDQCRVAPTCPSGSTLTGSVCTAVASCPAGATLNTSTNMCDVPYTNTLAPSCAAGTLNVSSDICETNSSCPAGYVPYGVGQCIAYQAYCSTLTTPPLWAAPTKSAFGNSCGTWNCGTSCPPAVDGYGASDALCTSVCNAYGYTSHTWWSAMGACSCATTVMCGSGFVNDATLGTCKSVINGTCSIGIFNVSNGLCESTPSCSSGAYNAGLNMCVVSGVNQVAPSCLAGMAYNGTTDSCEAALSCPASTTYSAASGQCEATPTCSAGSFIAGGDNCQNTTTSAASCQLGGALDNATDVCQTAHSCTTGSTWDAVANVCHVNETYSSKCEANPTCLSGQVYNSSTLKCETAPSCSVGTYDSVQNQCLQNITSAPSCPSLTAFVGGSVDMCQANYNCPAGTAINGSVCAATASCPSGGTLDTGTDQCNVPYTSTTPASCSIGSLNGATDFCETAATCPAGTTEAGSFCVAYAVPTCSAGAYNPTYDRCVRGVGVVPGCSAAACVAVGATGILSCSYFAPGQYLLTCQLAATCPAGYTIDGTLDTCVYTTSPNCASGTYNAGVCQDVPTCSTGAYDPAQNLCASGGVNLVAPSCFVGTTYNTTNDRCETNPVCPASTAYSAVAGMCQASPTCSTGAFVPSLDLCQIIGTSAASCPAGSTLNNTIDMCEANPSCQAGSTWNGITGKCDSNTICPTGGTYNASSGMCDIYLSVTPTCTAPTAWNNGSGKCEVDPTCPAGGSYNATLSLCVDTVAATCIAQTALNNGSNLCEAIPACPITSTYDITLNMCREDSIQDPGCPANSVISTSTNKCTASPVCGPGYTYDMAQMACMKEDPATCGHIQETLNPVTDMCESAPICATGDYSNTLKRCILTSAAGCPSGGMLNVALDVCQGNPGCSSGALDPSGMCANTGGATSPALCPTGALDPVLHVCASTPTCASGTYDAVVDQCVTQNTVTTSCPLAAGQSPTFNSATGNCFYLSIDPVTCTGGYVFQVEAGFGTACVQPLCMSPALAGVDSGGNSACITAVTAAATCQGSSILNPASNFCEEAPVCTADQGLFSTALNMCESFKKTCPLDTTNTTFSCLTNPDTQVLQCSPNECIDLAGGLPIGDTPADLTSLTNDGTIDPNSGQCMGQIVIFNGKASACRPPGTQTNYFNCCSNGSGWGPDFMMNCDQAKEFPTDQKKEAGRCHDIGEYCKRRWNIGVGSVCVQKERVYCCFESKLGRIIHEQGRPQLQRFAAVGWGTIQAPFCEGFKPEEFQMLDFSRMDLSEFVGDINTTVGANVQNNISNSVTNFLSTTTR